MSQKGEVMRQMTLRDIPEDIEMIARTEASKQGVSLNKAFHPDFTVSPTNEMQVRTLYDGSFIADHTNIIMVGGTGSGKTKKY